MDTLTTETTIIRNCGNCRSGWQDGRQRIHCGHAVDDGSVGEPGDNRNPIWATRKYGMAGMMAMLSGRTPAGSDCEDMDPGDGTECRTWGSDDG
jgi:hypothetical protein